MAEELSLALLRGVGDLHRRYRSKRDSGELGNSALDVLRDLGDGPTTLTALSEASRVSMASMSQTVNRLTAGGYAERAPDPADRRRVRISATRAGTEELARVRAIGFDWLDAGLAELTTAERETLGEAATLLRRLAAY